MNGPVVVDGPRDPKFHLDDPAPKPTRKKPRPSVVSEVSRATSGARRNGPSMNIVVKSLLVVSAVTVAMLAAVACGKPDADPGKTTTNAAVLPKKEASCNSTVALGTCSERSLRSRARTFGVEKQSCERVHGKFAMGGCPEVGQVGRCVLSDGETQRYDGSGPHARAAPPRTTAIRRADGSNRPCLQA